MEATLEATLEATSFFGQENKMRALGGAEDVSCVRTDHFAIKELLPGMWSVTESVQAGAR